mmetsp:Transcript_17718/g.36495  ORF Transcript_17718/g.36495 Transcript_17718/m.36495 type:complete len:247 (+) Transcript_17718:149-889(+)|eukprot:CAMPEP_0197262596 /NCGR_PEP_ID=MMETSP1432-20130617/578_1 /TAXON_ID=44447 /ORGANISM="Pseudo-nitzschia delicatissima, Strain UNC1205" /LENGTH=246 /DNA_ID=CAMNT_0042726899 /DNA_START=107 /DNA_END=847 /DNA_ORIENTATION=-
MTKKSSMIPMAALVFLFVNGVRGLASHRMIAPRRLSYHNPSSSAPLSYAIDSTKMGSDLRATMPQNLTLPLLLSDEELISQIQPSATTTTTRTRTNNILKYAWRKIKGVVKVDKEKIAKMGIDFFLTYNMISNINGSITLSTAWYIASMKTGLSPLAPGQWRSLLAAYASLYVVAALVRPLRIAIALGTTHKMEQLLQYMQKRIGCSRPSAIGMVFSFGVVLWLTCCAAGVSLASALAGVPLWKYS